MDDLEVIEVAASACQSSFTKKRKRPAKPPVPADLIQIIDDDSDSDDPFPQFATVADPSDHHFNSHLPPPPNSRDWARAVQRDWKILEKDLPETISVRVYDGKMQLLRAVIAGAAGTPYHDGLFFFDLYFPPQYPTVPPMVHYRSGGLRLNPNLYECGKVCLSLLNTWEGRREEKWCKKSSTVLQVLLSIQALVLNAKPYFNEPGYERSAGTPIGESHARDYNESTYILSCKTMLYALNNPPKHFEELVGVHFRRRGNAILAACKAYMEGAQVGCLAEGGVQDVDEGQGSCSAYFKDGVRKIVPSLVSALGKIGVKDCERFLPQMDQGPYQGDQRAGKRQMGQMQMGQMGYSVDYLQGLGSLLSL